MKYTSYHQQFSLLHNIANMVGMYNFLHSDEARQTFAQMANDNFEVDVAQIDQQDAQTLNSLIQVSDVFLLNIQSQPEIQGIFPQEIFAGMANVSQQLKPFEEYIGGIANGTLTNAQAEHKLMQWACQKLNDEHLLSIADSL